MPATDDNRPIKLTTPFGKDVLLFDKMTVSERLGHPFQLELSMLSDTGDLDANKILGESVCVSWTLPSGTGKRVFHGLVSDFTQLSYGERHHEYHATVRPWFWFLTRTADCRVFQDKSVREIFELLVKEKGFADFRFDLAGSYEKLAYCVQYRETAFNFLSRLLEHEGIYYYFEHTDQKHTMVLVDDSAKHKKVAGYDEVPYFPPSDTAVVRTRDHLSSWTTVKSVQTGVYATTDFDFKKPSTALLKTQKLKRNHGRDSLEIFDYPAELPADKDAGDTALHIKETERLAKVRLDELQAAYNVARGQGNAEGLAAGAQFKLSQYPRTDLNIAYLIVATNLSLAANAHESGYDGGAEFHASVEAIDLRTQFRPPRVTPKPVVQGAQTAIVVGKKGEEIDTDELGRIKVQFHWDRLGKKDETSSCRVRVAQVWAGQGWGAIHIPRIGQEVIVEFLEGDPDRPIVTGRVYNGEQKPPYALPENATQSGLKSRSSKKGGDKNFNEIRFEDKKGSEELVIHAEKDLKVDVENDGTWRIGLDETSPAKNKKGNAKILVGETVDADVGKTVKLVAGDEITFETGQSKIVMKKDGEITITCMKLLVKADQLIDLNSKQNIKGQASMNLELEGKLKFAAKGLQTAIEGTTQAEFKSSVNTKVEGMMLDLNGSAIASLKGALTKIG